MSVLVDHDIRHLSRPSADAPMIAPYVEENLQPASYDVTLANKFLIVDQMTATHIDLADPSTYSDIYKMLDIHDGEPLVLPPGGFVLGCTREYVRIPGEISCHIEGRSSIGRLGLVVHATAGYVDPGFHGNITLEIFNMTCVPIILRPGRTIAQLSFQRLSSAPDKLYDGRYQGDVGVAPSRYT